MLPGLDCVHDLIDSLHDVDPDLVKALGSLQLADFLMKLGIVAVDAVVDDAVQIEVQVV